MKTPKLREVPAPLVDAALAASGLVLASIGAAFVFGPAGLIVLGVGLFYLGALHR